MKEYIDTSLNPSTKNFYDPSRDSYKPALSNNKILSHLGLIRAEYEDALSISDDTGWPYVLEFLEIWKSPGFFFDLEKFLKLIQIFQFS